MPRAVVRLKASPLFAHYPREAALVPVAAGVCHLVSLRRCCNPALTPAPPPLQPLPLQDRAPIGLATLATFLAPDGAGTGTGAQGAEASQPEAHTPYKGATAGKSARLLDEVRQFLGSLRQVGP